MKAIQYAAHGGPEVLHLTDTAPEPSIRPGEVRIAVKASSVNPVDWKIVAGRPDMQVPLPAIPGRDAAGVVESVGEGVTRWAIGDEVITYGHEGRGVRSGGYAELMTVPADAAMGSSEARHAVRMAAYLSSWMRNSSLKRATSSNA